MFDRLNDVNAACEHALEEQLRIMFHRAPRIGDASVEVPFIGGMFPAILPVPRDMLQLVAAALRASEHWHKDAPYIGSRPWPQPLPLSWDAIAQWENGDDPRHTVVGHYACSWRMENWGEAHPRFSEFAGGVLALPDTPTGIRTALSEDFTAFELEGMGEDMVWRSPATIELDRWRAAECAKLEAAGAIRRERMKQQSLELL